MHVIQRARYNCLRPSRSDGARPPVCRAPRLALPLVLSPIGTFPFSGDDELTASVSDQLTVVAGSSCKHATLPRQFPPPALFSSSLSHLLAFPATAHERARAHALISIARSVSSRDRRPPVAYRLPRATRPQGCGDVSGEQETSRRRTSPMSSACRSHGMPTDDSCQRRPRVRLRWRRAGSSLAPSVAGLLQLDLYAGGQRPRRLISCNRRSGRVKIGLNGALRELGPCQSRSLRSVGRSVS